MPSIRSRFASVPSRCSLRLLLSTRLFASERDSGQRLDLCFAVPNVGTQFEQRKHKGELRKGNGCGGCSVGVVDDLAVAVVVVVSDKAGQANATQSHM